MKTSAIKSKLFGLIWSLLVLLPGFTQAQPALDDYVREGLKSNLVLQQKSISHQQAQQALQIARSYFLPSVNLLADYTSGEGGRSIAIPVGDLLNPVYASLNQMTQSDAFPQIENVEQNFFPKNFYDTRVRTSFPLVNTDIHLNRTIRGQQVMLKQYELEAYKRQLVAEIKTAYFKLLSATSAVKIYESAVALVNKNVEINESLLRHGKSLPANVLRSKSEAERVKAELVSAQNNVINARKYFNFLLNRDLDNEVSIDDSTIENMSISADGASADVQTREELLLLNTVREINQSSLRMSRLSRLPKVNAFLDVGSQANDWKVNNDSKYYLLGVQLSMPLFQGFRNNISIRQNNLEIKKTEYDLANTRKQLELSASIAKNEVAMTRQNFSASQEQLKSAQSYFNLIEKGYREGVNSLIEFLDARNQLTSSQLQQNVRRLEMLTADARLERETSAYIFEN
ncbi:MAG: TolC family protein [Bacteroidota bacterium]